MTEIVLKHQGTHGALQVAAHFDAMLAVVMAVVAVDDATGVGAETDAANPVAIALVAA